MIRNKSSLNTVTEYPIDPDSIISIRTHFWCNGMVIDNQLQDHQSKSETITLYHLRENTIRGQPRLLAIRWLALTSIMKSEWGRSFHKYGTTFRIYQSSRQYCTVHSLTTHVELDLDNPRNNSKDRGHTATWTSGTRSRLKGSNPSGFDHQLQE